MSFRQRRKRVIWSHRGRGARRNARCFFLLIAPLHLPQAARCSEPVNSRCGCVWQGRRFGSASKVKKSRKTGVSLLFLAPPVGLEPTTLRLTVVVTRISNSIIRFHTVYNRDFTYITQLINGSRGAKNR